MTDFLFARPSFWEGFGRVIDLGATLNAYNASSNSAEADFRALEADWKAIGQDMREAIRQVEQQIIHQQ